MSTPRLMMDEREIAKKIEKRLLAGEDKLWCYNTCLVNKIEIINMTRYGFTETVKLLLESGKYAKEKTGRSINNAFLHACLNKDLVLYRILLEAGADVHYEDNYALNHAAEYGHQQMVKVLLNEYSSNYDIGEHGRARVSKALWCAQKSGEGYIAEILKEWRDNHP